MASEKTLPTVNVPQPTPARRNTRAWALVGAAAMCWWLSHPLDFFDLTPDSAQSDAQRCVQAAPTFPLVSSDKLVEMDEFLKSAAFEEASILRLSGAVKIPTMSYDDMGVIGEDKRWEVMYDFASYLEKTFPLCHEKLELDTVNTHGLVYTWKGADASLKPTLLMAHQDVVPVPESTIDSWTHPPFSGHYDGKYIWGRGSSDCKNQLIAIMESVESLLVANFTPQRTVLLSFGFDEEISGREGAGHLAPFILDRYGKDGVAVIVDEGAGFSSQWGTTMATPGVAEKGYTDVTITIRMPGGHSSIPPPHTSIGVLAELIALVEANPYPTRLHPQNPYLSALECGAAHGPTFPSKLKKLLPEPGKHAHQCKAKPDLLALEAAKAGLGVKYLMQTSLAVDVITGGVKVNALPERAAVTINHRVNVGEAAAQVHNKITRLATGVAQKYNLTLHAFTGSKESPQSIILTQSANTLEPAPVTPTGILGTPYGVLSGTTRGLYGEGIVMAPGIMTGNTDTRYYWDVTEHIFRYSPGWVEGEDGLGRNIHTVDEHVSVKAHVAGVRWFSAFVRNMEEEGAVKWMVDAEFVHGFPELRRLEKVYLEIYQTTIRLEPSPPSRGKRLAQPPSGIATEPFLYIFAPPVRPRIPHSPFHHLNPHPCP